MPSTSKLPLIVIFGRTNVGKSTLFNCLVEKRQALISDVPGTTRDSNIASVEWRGHQFELIDTGGFMNLDFLSQRKIKAVSIDELVQKQARDYLKKADVIIFAVDAKEGLLPQDKQMASILKRIIPDLSKVIIIANKVDAFKRIPEVSDFYSLGLGQVYPVSAATGAGTGDMLDAVLEILHIDPTKTKRLDEDEEEVDEEEMTESAQEEKHQKELAAQPIKVCILGKPNVGKSSLLNAILGYNRVIVSEVPHTTREPQSTNFTYKNKPLVLVDTAGITKHGHKSHTLEKFSMDKSLASLKKSDIALLILDINDPLTKQDSRLVEEIFDRKKSLILVANKWDLADERDTKNLPITFMANYPLQLMLQFNLSQQKIILKLITY